jgi:hypothetical protein
MGELKAQNIMSEITRVPKCPECGACYCFYPGGWEPEPYYREGHPARGPKVFEGVPAWLRVAINRAYPLQVRCFLSPYSTRRKLSRGGDAERFLLNFPEITANCPMGFLDHYGHDAANNFVAEPYALHCAGCRKDAQLFAESIGADLTVTRPTWHAPWLTECVRMEFSNRRRNQ